MSKVQSANTSLKSCLTEYGIQASDDRYRGQFWTRDACQVSRFIIDSGDEELIGYVVKHFLCIAEKQQENGKVPILYIEGFDNIINFIEDKVRKSKGQDKLSFMLRRVWEDGQKGIQNLTDHTRDGELLFIVNVTNLFEKVKLSQSIYDKLSIARDKAYDYVSKFSGGSFIKGADWRDTRVDLNDKEILSNAVLLFKAFQIYDNQKEANRVLQVLNKTYWNGDYFIDYPSSDQSDQRGDKFDILGNAFAIIYDVATEDQKQKILDYASRLKTKYGFKLEDTFLPPQNDKEKEDMDENKAVVWPYLSFVLVEAMILTGRVEEAKEMFDEFDKLDGFNEWYSISTGEAFGSPQQLWTVSYYLRIHWLLFNNKKVDNLFI